MSTTISGLFNINGVVSTDKSVMQNVNMLANAVGCWVTYDIAVGKWSVVINRAGSSVASFNDGNIIGGINITGTGVSELYNAVTIQFPHKDLRDQTDYIDYELDPALRFPNELDNTLNISLDLINDPIQAEYIAVSELKQSRIDKVVTFRTDYTNLGLKAGDLIDVTNSHYGYTNKVFRITKMEEDDAEGLVIAITALEYDADVYSTAGLTRKIREKKTGIIPKDANEALTSSDTQAGIVQYTSLVFNFYTGLITIAETPYSTTSTETFLAAFPNSGPDRYATGQSFVIPYTGFYRTDYFFNFGAFLQYDDTGEPKLPNNIRKRVRVNVTLNGVFAETGNSGVPGGATSVSTSSVIMGDDPLTDIIVAGFFYATKGQVLDFFMDVRSDLGPNHPVVIAKGEFAGTASFVILSANLFYLGATTQ
jgi:hypothetical protein